MNGNEKTFSVLLKQYSKLPHLELAEEVATMVGMHKMDVTIRLRWQQGIVWSGLVIDNADKLAKLLIGKGFECGIVPDSDLWQGGKPFGCRNADVLQEGFEMEDAYGKKKLIPAEKIAFAQAGWVEEKIRKGRYRGLNEFGMVFTGGFGTYQPPVNFHKKREPDKRAIGWVLHLFLKGIPGKSYRIIGREFNYDYQGFMGEYWEKRFAILLSDLAVILADDCLDDSLIRIMGKDHPDREGVTYDRLKFMMERARWELTMRQLAV